MSYMVETVDLTKKYGTMTAVHDLNLTVEEGCVLGFIGPNGAGKSTTLKMLATILRPTSGVAKVDGRIVTENALHVRRTIGYMPDVCGLYEDMMVHEYLRFFSAIYGKRGKEADRAVDEVLGLVGFESKVNELCGALSRGMSQRLHLARVLLHDPKLLLLDEPASGLDPRARIEFKELVMTLKRLGKTLIISSHILSELGEMCDSIAIIEKSEMVYNGPVQDAHQSLKEEGRIFSIRALEETDAGRSFHDLLETIRHRPYVDAVRESEDGAVLVRFKDDFDDYFELNRELIAREFKVLEFAEEKIRLEDTFLHLTKGLVQ